MQLYFCTQRTVYINPLYPTLLFRVSTGICTGHWPAAGLCPPFADEAAQQGAAYSRVSCRSSCRVALLFPLSSPDVVRSMLLMSSHGFQGARTDATKIPSTLQNLQPPRCVNSALTRRYSTVDSAVTVFVERWRGVIRQKQTNPVRAPSRDGLLTVPCEFAACMMAGVCVERQ